MQITKATEYGVRVVLELSSRTDLNQPVTIDEICRLQDIPVKYFRKMIILLINASLVRSFRGPKGGLALAKRPGNISLYDVIRVTEGEINLNVCLLGMGDCEREESCPVHNVWERAQQALVSELKKTDFAALGLAYREQKKGS